MNPTVTHPTAVVVHRDEPRRDRSWTPQISERLPVIERVETAPLPPQDTLAYAQGRDAAHQWGYVWRYQALAIQDWLSVAGWPFKFGKVPVALRLSQPRAGQNPTRERANIAMNPQITYGDLTGVDPGSYAPQYAKLT